MRELFATQIQSVVNTKQKDPLMFYIVSGKVEHCSLSVIEKLEDSLTYIESRTVGELDLPVFTRK